MPAVDCPRCHATLYRSRDEEAAGECLQCGPIYVPVASPQELEEQARADAYPLGPRQRVREPALPGTYQLARRSKPNQYGITGDGCDEAPSCLDCPLPECKFVGIDANTCDVCASVFATRPALVSHRKGCTEAHQKGRNP